MAYDAVEPITPRSLDTGRVRLDLHEITRHIAAGHGVEIPPAELADLVPGLKPHETPTISDPNESAERLKAWAMRRVKL